MLSIIVLAGGLGSRLYPKIGACPKILSKIGDLTFLLYLLDWLNKSLDDVPSEVILSTGYLHEHIDSFLRDTALDIKVSREMQQLGTLGGARLATSYCLNEDVLVLNGDTLFSGSLKKAYFTYKSLADPLLVVGRSTHSSRYECYEVDDSKVSGIEYDKPYHVVSMGALFISKSRLKTDGRRKTSDGKGLMMDRDLIRCIECKYHIIPGINEFIDIGVPDEYDRARNLLPELKKHGWQWPKMA